MYNDYYVKVCLQGHKINCVSKTPALGNEFCPKCGNLLLSFCPKCNSKIPTPEFTGRRFPDVAHYILPTRCNECKHLFPWHKSNKIQSLKQELLYIETRITDFLKSILSIF